MRAIMLLIVGYSLSELGFTGDRGGQPAPCSAPELSGVSRAYDALVCAGLASYREAQYATAVERFVAARKIPLEDFPNVWILARLAQAQWMSGDRIGAKSTLAQAELSIQILTGVFVCTFDDANAAVSDRLGRAISARGLDDLVKEMCSPGYEGAYGNWSLQGVKRSAALIGVLEEATRLIRGP